MRKVGPTLDLFRQVAFSVIDSKTHEIIRTGQYWALAHYARAARRGALRFDSQGQIEKVSHVAFAHPNGSCAAVLTNTGAERNIHLQLAGMAAEVVLPEASVLTLTWK
jgi:hypothetical protein